MDFRTSYEFLQNAFFSTLHAVERDIIAARHAVLSRGKQAGQVKYIAWNLQSIEGLLYKILDEVEVGASYADEDYLSQQAEDPAPDRYFLFSEDGALTEVSEQEYLAQNEEED